jgi:hypothetical protein
MVHTDIGFDQLAKVAEELGNYGKIVVSPKLMGRQIAMELVPDRLKMAAAAKENKGATISDDELNKQVEALDRADALDVDDDDDDELDGVTGEGEASGEGEATAEPSAGGDATAEATADDKPAEGA